MYCYQMNCRYTLTMGMRSLHSVSVALVHSYIRPIDLSTEKKEERDRVAFPTMVQRNLICDCIQVCNVVSQS